MCSEKKTNISESVLGEGVEMCAYGDFKTKFKREGKAAGSEIEGESSVMTAEFIFH